MCLQNAGVHKLFSSAMAEFTPCALERSNTRGRSHIIEDVIETGKVAEPELKETPLEHNQRSSIRVFWEKQKKKIALEFEGVWSLGRR